ncbi:MAG: hypothetical protein H7Y03_03335 [Chitinophagaceae bacterium]|nr:hypothetical protein [Chitinophagaceae bacterium]
MVLRSCALLLLFTHFACSQLSAQSGDYIRQQSCKNDAFVPQIDSIKKAMSSLGYVTVREASMAMESAYEMPVIAPLNKDSWYYFIFIGDISSRLYEVRMFDASDRQLFYKKNMWGEVDGNIIGYPYIPSSSELHMIKTVQVNKKKKKDLCGYFMILKKVQNAG